MLVELSKDHMAESVFLLQPTRPILCTTKNDDGSDHVAPFSWVNPVSQNPPRLALALLNSPRRQHSLENIEKTGEFVVNIPDLILVESLVRCSYKTKRGENKFERSGYTRLPSIKVAPPSIKECRAHLECKLVQAINAGDHTLLIADIVHASYDNNAYGKDLLIKADAFEPVIHVTNYCLPDSQVHIFLRPGGEYVVNVPYYEDE